MLSCVILGLGGENCAQGSHLPGGFSQPVSPSSRGEELPPQYGKFCSIFCSKTIRGVAAPAAPLRLALVTSQPHAAHVTATALNFPLGKPDCLQVQTPACASFSNELGSAFPFARPCKQLSFPTAWPFTVANLHICIWSGAAPGRSSQLSNEICRPSAVLHEQWLTGFLDCIIYCG